MSSLFWSCPIHKNQAIFNAEAELMTVAEGGGIVDIRTGRMVAVNKNCGNWSNLSPEEFKNATEWTRDLYIHPEDIEMILRETRQLSINSETSFIDLTIRYGDATEGVIIRGNDQIIGKVTNRYRVLEDEDGLLWHLGTNIPGSNIPLAD